MPCTINNNTSRDLSQLKDLTNKLVPFAQKQIGFNRPPTINFNSDEKNSLNPLGKTGHYDPQNDEIVIFVDGRHIKDVLRSVAHELVHHGQNCRGEFDRSFSTDPGYAQNDEFLRGMEREAYETGNLCFRDWEDGIKQQLPLYETIYKEIFIEGEEDMSNMSTKEWKDQELNSLLMDKWGLKALEQVNEGIPTTIVNDYRTGQKVLDEDDEDGDEPIDEDIESSSQLHLDPQSVEVREEQADKDYPIREGSEYSDKIDANKYNNKDPYFLFDTWLNKDDPFFLNEIAIEDDDEELWGQTSTEEIPTEEEPTEEKPTTEDAEKMFKQLQSGSGDLYNTIEKYLKGWFATVAASQGEKDAVGAVGNMLGKAMADIKKMGGLALNNLKGEKSKKPLNEIEIAKLQLFPRILENGNLLLIKEGNPNARDPEELKEIFQALGRIGAKVAPKLATKIMPKTMAKLSAQAAEKAAAKIASKSLAQATEKGAAQAAERSLAKGTAEAGWKKLTMSPAEKAAAEAAEKAAVEAAAKTGAKGAIETGAKAGEKAAVEAAAETAAKSPGMFRRVGKWIRKHPIKAGLLGFAAYDVTLGKGAIPGFVKSLMGGEESGEGRLGGLSDGDLKILCKNGNQEACGTLKNRQEGGSSEEIAPIPDEDSGKNGKTVPSGGGRITVDRGKGYLNLWSKLTPQEKAVFGNDWKRMRAHFRQVHGGGVKTRPMLHPNKDYRATMNQAMKNAASGGDPEGKFYGAWKRRKKKKPAPAVPATLAGQTQALQRSSRPGERAIGRMYDPEATTSAQGATMTIPDSPTAEEDIDAWEEERTKTSDERYKAWQEKNKAGAL